MAFQNSSGYRFWILERGDNLSSVARNAFGLSNGPSVHRKVIELIRINPHITNPDHLHPGQTIALGPVSDVTTHPIYETDLRAMQHEFCRARDHRNSLLDNWPLFHGIASMDSEEHLPITTSPYTVARAFESDGEAAVTRPYMKIVPGYSYKGIKVTNATLHEASKGRFGTTKSMQHVFQSVEGQLVRAFGDRLRYINRPDNVAHLIPANSRAFTNGGKVLVVNPEVGTGWYNYSKAVRAAGKVAEAAKYTGKVFKLIDLGVYLTEIGEAKGSPDQNRRISASTGKYAAGLGMSLISTGVAGQVCALLTFTTGAGGVACYVSTLIVISTGSSKIGEAIGGYGYDFLNSTIELYRSNAPVFLGN